jgi:hypothetical protein
MIDPLHAFVDGAFVAGTERAIPLIATRFDVRIAHGLAIVSTTRTFRNDEPASIEATITFPIPVHAVLFALEARIDGRVLKAKAQRKTQARETYEDALERGKSAVLHEEVLRGVHMLSVGHIPAGAEIVVSTNWAMTLTNINGRGRLRIPLTVGEIYGRSGLPDSDDLNHGGQNPAADLRVSCLDGQVKLIDGSLQNSGARVPLNAPIDLEVTNWTPHDLYGSAADGRKVVLRIEPSPVSDAALDVALMIDRSGSMQEQCSGGRKRTKHAAIVRSLQDSASSIGLADVIELWEFNDEFNHVGSTRDGQDLKALVKRLKNPDGGTNIGRALEGLTDQSKVRDVLLVTDGKSHELDVQALTQTGHRYSVVLVGEDSLEANVGYLAALTGGEVFVASGADLADVINQSLRSLRTVHKTISPIAGPLEQLSACRAGMSIVAAWQRTEELLPDGIDARAVAAFSASLALPALDLESAAVLAEKEELVTHLTSLVLVDEAAEVQEGIPGARKIPLPTPRTALHAMYSAQSVRAYAMAPSMAMMERVDRISSYSLRASELDAFFEEPPRRTHGVDLPPPFQRLVELIEQSPSRLEPSRAGKLLKEAGLEREFEGISRHAQDLGLKAETVLSIVLAGLLRGPLGESLSADIQGACMPLQEFAQRAMEAIREIGDRGPTLMHAIQDAAGLNLVQSARTDEAVQALGRLGGYRQMLAHIERFLHEQADELKAFQAKNARGGDQAAGILDLSGIGANINWDVEPDRLRGGDLSELDRPIAGAIQDAAELTEVSALARRLGIDPVIMIVGLIARNEAQKNRTAARIAKAILTNVNEDELTALARTLRLD